MRVALAVPRIVGSLFAPPLVQAVIDDRRQMGFVDYARQASIEETLHVRLGRASGRYELTLDTLGDGRWGDSLESPSEDRLDNEVNLTLDHSFTTSGGDEVKGKTTIRIPVIHLDTFVALFQRVIATARRGGDLPPAAPGAV